MKQSCQAGGSSGSQKVGVHLFARLATVVALLMADG